MKTAYYNAKVYTGTLPLCEAFLVEDGVFRMAGDRESVLGALSGEDARVDLKGAFVCPGFNDSHMHLLSFGNTLRSVQLKEHTRSLSGMLDHVRAWIRENPPREGQWVLGRGWNQDFFSDVKRMPCREDLDAVSREIPIMLTRACGHACVLNSKALALSGIDSLTVSPEGGAIGMENGRPDGRLYDNAMEIAQKALPVPGREEIREMLRAASRAVNRYGITSVQTDDFQVFQGVPWQMIREVYQEMEQSGEMTVRVNEQAQFTSPASLKAFLDEGLRTGSGTDVFRIGPIKLLGDGSLGSRTAHLSRPYADDPRTCGFSLYAPETLKEMVSMANAHGMSVAVHAIGDRCLDEVLDAIEAALKKHPRDDHRHGIVHCQISRKDQLKRIRDLHLHIYAQSIFLDYDNHIVAERAGEELAATSYSWKTLLRDGVSVSNGSDCPVELPDVMEGMECAVTRTSMDGTGPYLPDEAFTVQEAIDSFTWRGAEASFEEDFKGRIAPGFLADFTVLSENPFEAEAGRLHAIPVKACYMDGKCVYEG